MSGKKKIFGINLFDIVILAIIVVLAGGVYVFTHKEKVVETKKLRYTLELADNPAGFSKDINIGDRLTDNVKNYNMGTVVDFEVVPCTKITNDYVNSAIVESVVPDKENVIITVEANVTESANEYKVDGNYYVRAGREVSVKGNGYAGIGYILTVDRQEGAQ